MLIVKGKMVKKKKSRRNLSCLYQYTALLWQWTGETEICFLIYLQTWMEASRRAYKRNMILIGSMEMMQKGKYCALILGNVKLLLGKLRKAMKDRFKKEGSNTRSWLLTTTLDRSKQDRRKQRKIMRVVSMLQWMQDRNITNAATIGKKKLLGHYCVVLSCY